jgi:hypothetical protein
VGEVKNDAAIMAALGRQMTQAVQKQTVAASNLANLDTPGYRTLEVSFSDALDSSLQAGVMTVTNSKHLGGPTVGAPNGDRLASQEWPIGDPIGLPTRPGALALLGPTPGPFQPLFDVFKRSQPTPAELSTT